MVSVIDFYSERKKDHRGRSLSEILSQSDEWLEYTHDYIQWIFPNKERGMVNPYAPIIEKETIEEFKRDIVLQQKLKRSFERMLNFYGLSIFAYGIDKNEEWNSKSIKWFTEDTHNNLRITRILKCLMTLQLQLEARQFLNTLERLSSEESTCGISMNTFKYWEDAVSCFA